LEFDATDPNKYLPADYWVFRATPSQKPGVLVDMEPPHGVKYRRAPLAILTLRKGKNTRRANKILDCRRIFNPLTKPSQPISDRIFRVRVRVDGRLWKEVPSLSTREPDDKVYEVITDAVGRTYVQFGDGVHGQRLPSGTGRITASYRNRSGDTGRVSIKLGKETDPDQIRLMLLPEVSLERS
jgi:hypothetical protein